MARRGVPKQINWYLREWMEVCGLRGRGAQTKMMDLTGWSKATMSQLYNNKQDYSPEILNQAAKALHVETWELLMHPDRAMRLRRIQADAQGIAKLAAESGGDEFKDRVVAQQEPDDDDDTRPREAG